MVPDFHDFDRQRIAAGLSVAALCKNANVSLLTYKRWRTGRTARLKLRTIARLRAAVAGRSVAVRTTMPDDLVRQHFRAVLAICSHAAGLTILDALQVDTRANRPRDQDWLAIMRCRQAAMYIVNTEGNIRAADLARALKISKQAVSKALHAIEDKRDDRDFDAYLRRVADLMKENAP